jgi:hypothetical protein
MIPDSTTEPGTATAGASGRENHPVPELPPPPPPGAPVPPPTGTNGPRSRSPIASADPSEWDWDRIRDLAERWFRPLVEPAGWRALGYLFVGMMAGIGFFVALTATAAVVFGLTFVVVGIFLIAPWFGLVRVFADAERAMAGWMGVTVPPRELRPAGTLGWRTITDPERWRMVGYLALNVVLAPALFGAGSFLYSLVFSSLFSPLGSSGRSARRGRGAGQRAVDPAPGHPRRRRERAASHRAEPPRRRPAAARRDRARPRHGRAAARPRCRRGHAS